MAKHYTGKTRAGSGRRVLCVAMAAVTMCGSVGFAADKPAAKPLQSGPKVGSYVPSFYTRAVTGPLMNKSLCYVCRNGQRPVVMFFLRGVGRELKPLVQGVDKLIDKHRADGLRGFGVYLSADSVKATSAVQTFAFNNKIAMPLTIAGETVAAAGGQNVHRDAVVTVVLYRRRRVVKTWAFRAGELKATDAERLCKRIEQIAIPD